MHSMFNGVRRSRTRTIGAGLALTLVAVMAPATTQAADVLTSPTAVSATVDSSGIQVTAPAAVSFAAASLTGRAATLDADIGDWMVNDARGEASSKGWTVTAAASAVTVDTDGAGPGAAAEVPGMAPVLDMDAATALVGSGPAPVMTGGTLTGTGATLLDAGVDAGVGEWQVTQGTAGVKDLHLALPYNARAGDYASTVTFTLTPKLT